MNRFSHFLFKGIEYLFWKPVEGAPPPDPNAQRNAVEEALEEYDTHNNDKNHHDFLRFFIF